MPHTIKVTTANFNDRQGAVLTRRLNADTLYEVVKVLVDRSYTGEPFAHRVEMILDADVEVAQQSKLNQFSVIPKRWIVECSFAWPDKCRRLWKD